MSRLHTYGSLCELTAAGQLFDLVFEVYRNGELCAKFGNEGNPVERLRFTQDLASGHFDVYLPYERDIASNSNTLPSFTSIVTGCSQQSSPSISTLKTLPKRRARYTDATRKKQVRVAAKNYSQSNPEVHRASAKKYQQENPEVHRAAVATYNQNHVAERVERQIVLWKDKAYSGFTYDPYIDYENDKTVSLGAMCQKCVYCNAATWKEEAPGMCCSAGKVQLPPLEPLPELLYSLLMNTHPEHTHFMDRIRKYNGCFQMTSFGAKRIIEDGFMPTFKVQGQVYHLVAGLLPTAHQEPQFLQIYFVGEDEREARLRCNIFPDVKESLVKQLQRMLHENNKYIRDLKTALDNVPPNCEFEVVIHADRNPTGGHKGRFNAPTANEVALVMVGQQFQRRDIVLQSHDNTLRRISEVHRSYDSLQYPLMFCRGENGYSVDILQRHPTTKEPLKKMVSAASFYSYRLMVRQEETNVFHII